MGRGHVARSLSLAEALGEPVAFYLDPGGEDAVGFAHCGFAVEREEGAGRCDRLMRALGAGRLRGVVFDGYDFGDREAAAVMEHAVCVRIDDFGSARTGTLVVNPTIGAAAADSRAAGARALCGAEYALLASGFAAENRRARRQRPAGAGRILVAFGARDGRNHSGAVLAALRTFGDRIGVTVVLGRDAPHLADVAGIVAGMRNARLVVDAGDMIAIYRTADLAIGSGGVSLLERMCCGLPSLVVAAADNQRGNIEGALRLGAAALAGAADTLDRETLAGAIAALIEDDQRRAGIRAAGLALVDGRGAERVAAAMREIRGVNPAGLHV